MVTHEQQRSKNNGRNSLEKTHHTRVCFINSSLYIVGGEVKTTDYKKIYQIRLSAADTDTKPN